MFKNPVGLHATKQAATCSRQILPDVIFVESPKPTAVDSRGCFLATNHDSYKKKIKKKKKKEKEKRKKKEDRLSIASYGKSTSQGRQCWAGGWGAGVGSSNCV